MSSPEGTQARRPLRTAGLIVLALGAAAALIGLLSIPTGDDDTSAGDRPPVTEPPPDGTPVAPSPTPSPVLPTVSPVPTTVSPLPSPVPPVSPPATTSPAPAPGVLPQKPSPPPAPVPTDTDVAASGKGISRGEVRVYNNSTIRGLASRVAADLSAAGWTVVAVDNYSGGRIPTTTVYYQEGTDQRAIAEAIGAEFGLRVEPRFPGIANASPGVIVIATNDYGAGGPP